MAAPRKRVQNNGTHLQDHMRVHPWSLSRSRSRPLFVVNLISERVPFQGSRNALAIYATGVRAEETSDEVAASISIDCYVLVQKKEVCISAMSLLSNVLSRVSRSLFPPLSLFLSLNCFEFHLPAKMTHNIT